jgi:hypothetical protein
VQFKIPRFAFDRNIFRCHSSASSPNLLLANSTTSSSGPLGTAVTTDSVFLYEKLSNLTPASTTPNH